MHVVFALCTLIGNTLEPDRLVVSVSAKASVSSALLDRVESALVLSVQEETTFAARTLADLGRDGVAKPKARVALCGGDLACIATFAIGARATSVLLVRVVADGPVDVVQVQMIRLTVPEGKIDGKAAVELSTRADFGPFLRRTLKPLLADHWRVPSSLPVMLEATKPVVSPEAPRAVVAAAAPPASPLALAEQEPVVTKHPLLISGATLGAVGVASLVVAIALGASSQQLTPVYGPQGTTQVDALAASRRAEGWATGANAMFGVGGGLIAVGGTLIAIDLISRARGADK